LFLIHYERNKAKGKNMGVIIINHRKKTKKNWIDQEEMIKINNLYGNVDQICPRHMKLNCGEELLLFKKKKKKTKEEKRTIR